MVGLARVPVLFALVISSGVAGCSPLSPRKDPSRFFLLTSPPSEADAPPLVAGTLGGAIAVGPLDLPAYLSGPLLVTRIDDNEVRISDFERWAEPLRDNMVRVLAENLSRQLRSRVVVFPALLSEEVRLRVPIAVKRFERDSSGAVELHARWSLHDIATGKTVEYGNSTIHQAALGVGGDGSVATMSEALASLSREIAAAIRGLPEPPERGPAPEPRR
jgi:uncharacterized lipoprotein YmbA